MNPEHVRSVLEALEREWLAVEVSKAYDRLKKQLADANCTSGHGYMFEVSTFEHRRTEESERTNVPPYSGLKDYGEA